MEASPRLPGISISRTSSESSIKHPNKQTRPLLPRVKTDHTFYPHWKIGKGPANSWNRHDPAPEWHIKWDQHCFQNGRVLIIDYKSNDELTETGKRHIAVAAQELQTLPELRKFYSEPKRVHGAALRVIHVQNATHWATPFLLRKFNIDNPSELVGMSSFSKWARYKEVRQRNGKPAPNGRSWRGQTDPWRNVSRTAFGMDYLKAFPTAAPNRRQDPDACKPNKVMHINAYEDSRSPYGYDLCVQRISAYVQRNLGPPQQISPELNIKNPYAKHIQNSDENEKDQECQLLDYLDNSNTIIVFENSASGKLEDCLIQPRNDFETRWRRLSFYLRKEDVLNDSRLAAQCSNFILTDLFHGLGVVWDELLGAASDHVAILEDKIYENPADESRAPELWTNQAAWLKVDKVMWIHSDMVKEMQGHMRELADAEDEMNGVDVDWLASTAAEYDRISHTISEDLIQPTDNLSDLMYKSVGIRDSRQSLQLGLSMWRLSWITFIFLPLTFIVGFFGMNVDTFAGNPSIAWYFVAAAVLMVFVLLLWYCVKHSLQRSRQTPYQRGLYESLFNDLEEEYPQLWTSNGAVASVEPVDFAGRMKWRLLKRWFSPEKTINKRIYSSLAPEEQASELGAWAAFKRTLLLRWLPDISASQKKHDEDQIELAEAGNTSETTETYAASALSELIKASSNPVVAEAEPTAAAPLHLYGLRALNPRERISVASRTSEDRPSSRGSSGIMIEERNLSDSESDVGEGVVEGVAEGAATSSG